MSISLVSQLGAVQMEVDRMANNAPTVGTWRKSEHAYQLECLRAAATTLREQIRERSNKGDVDA